MSYLLIYDSLYKHVRGKFPNRKYNANIGKSRHDNRFIQIYTPLDEANIHYEYIRGRVYLHFEDDTVYKYRELIDFLMRKTENDVMFEWGEWNGDWLRCKYLQYVETTEQLDASLEIVMSFFDKLINTFYAETTSSSRKEIPPFHLDFANDTSVELYNFNLRNILGLQLAIPSYQRVYCWKRRHVLSLLEDVSNHLDSKKSDTVPYRLGTIILHCHDGIYDLIDGQQRLVTLSLLLNEMGIHSNLLDERMYSREASEHVAYNKFLIQNYLQKYRSRLSEDILTRIDFNVLILQNASLDLAYTFFSNENSRGVELTDYDLLKAHHLRYIPTSFEAQSRKLAEGWNNMILRGRATTTEGDTPNYERVLDTYIYHLRRWMRQKECEADKRNRYVKREYEAAPIMDEIPPFGERFYFNEPIQGGSHFFSFVEQHLNIYKHFIETKEYCALHHNNGLYGSDLWYRDVIEAVLFAYYAKFGEVCLADAFMVIMRAVLQHRYENRRARKSSILRYAGEQRYVQMIDQATSPTFFLAEVRNVVKDFPVIYLQELTPTQKRMKQVAKAISKELSDNILIDSFKTLNK